MYNTIIDGVLSYHKRRERITEFQEHKQLNLNLVKAKPVIISRHPVAKAKLNSDMGLLVFSTSMNEICIYNTLTSERIDSIQEAQDKLNTQPVQGQVFINPALEFQQEMLIVMDEVGLNSQRAKWLFMTVESKEKSQK